MIITRHSEGTFKVQTGGVAIVIDPTDNRLKSDITLTTKTKLPLGPSGSPAEIIGPGEYDLRGVRISGFLAAKSDETIETLYEVAAEDVRILFLGRPTKALDLSVQERLGEIDIVFAPPGTASFVKQLDAKIIVPTHVKAINQIDKDFGSKVESVEKLTTKKKDLPTQAKVIFINA
jgi:L-ascorbate metabolism protein UlaG (beta-lactamase superfamily)